MASRVQKLVNRLIVYGFGILNFFLYLGLAIKSGSFFKKQTDQEKLQLAIAQDAFWNLTKTVAGLSHHFFELTDGRKLHYLCNNSNADSWNNVKPLIIFIHGFPDSCLIWRHLFETTPVLLDKATVVAVDLPGYGGSDGFEKYGPEQVLEALREFIVAMRDEHIDRGYFGDLDGYAQKQAHSRQQVYIVGHDWGCVLAFRLAADAPQLADRFIVANGPLTPLALANKDRLLDSSSKIFSQFRQAPIGHRSCFFKAFDTIKPLLIQILYFGYIAAFHLPRFMVRYLGSGGNYAFLRGAQRAAYGKNEAEYNVAESMACTMGPSVNELKTELPKKNHADAFEDPLTYGPDVVRRAKNPGAFFIDQTAYYRDGVATQRWEKSLETIAALHNIQAENAASSDPRRRRNSSASSGPVEPLYKGSLRAPATIVWGLQDQACTQRICLDGIKDYLTKGSWVLALPRTGHWTPVEKESRVAFAEVIEYYLDEVTKGTVAWAISKVYSDVNVLVTK